jgi:hypothetical protein
MANKIKLKRTSVAGRQPTNLDVGEISLNMADKTLLFKDHNNDIQEISGTAADTASTAVAMSIALG